MDITKEAQEVMKLIMGIISNVWYFININGTGNGLFRALIREIHSISLFAIEAEVLPRLLNNLMHSEHFLFLYLIEGLLLIIVLCR